MSDQNHEISIWPLLEDGARTDRGWLHWARMQLRVEVPAEASMFEARFVVHTDETWALLWAGWLWDEAVPWESLSVVRVLADGEDLAANVGSPASPLSEHDWEPMGDTREQEVWDTALASVAVEGDLWPTDLAANVWPGRSRLIFRWRTTDAAGGSTTLTLDLLLLRIRYAERRRWTKADVESFMGDIAELVSRID